VVLNVNSPYEIECPKTLTAFDVSPEESPLKMPSEVYFPRTFLS